MVLCTECGSLPLCSPVLEGRGSLHPSMGAVLVFIHWPGQRVREQLEACGLDLPYYSDWVGQGVDVRTLPTVEYDPATEELTVGWVNGRGPTAVDSCQLGVQCLLAPWAPPQEGGALGSGSETWLWSRNGAVDCDFPSPHAFPLCMFPIMCIMVLAHYVYLSKDPSLWSCKSGSTGLCTFALKCFHLPLPSQNSVAIPP